MRSEDRAARNAPDRRGAVSADRGRPASAASAFSELPALARKRLTFAKLLGHQITGTPGLPPEIELHTKSAWPRSAAFVYRGVNAISVREDHAVAGPRQVFGTILHELRHLEQFAKGFAVDPATDEPDAEMFAARWTQALVDAWRLSGGEHLGIRVRADERPSFSTADRPFIVLARGAAWTYSVFHNPTAWLAESPSPTLAEVLRRAS